MKNFRLILALLFLGGLFITTPACEEDPCDSIICLNNGVCINGVCNCPEGYTGSNCGTQVTPTAIRITNIRVTEFPATDGNGGGWDLTTGGDIYVELFYNNQSIYYSNYYENANPSLVYDFAPTVNVNMAQPTNQYTIALYDYDELDPDDLMGAISFTPYSNTNGFPTKLTIDANTGLVFELTVTYDF